MIGSLRGLLLERRPDGEVLVEVAGVGYRVQMTPRSALSLGEEGSEVFVYVHHHVPSQGPQGLFGFLSPAERDCFEALLAAHGVGPQLALAILSVHSPSALQRILLEEDQDALCLVPGVGKKTAQRLMVELRSRLDLDELGRSAGVGGTISTAPEGTVIVEVREALTALGYGPDEIRAALGELSGEEHDAASALRQALSVLGAPR
ncbi:MAG: Holliday junction ATP-dependent DNA helicase RuvA [Acidimicrobiales bacterium]|nr:MAG: Holliday junction ATP-dependent DNA helicase RuvA [Acidimicrobiales bacterium]